ncbi:hypothetical protein UCREL1_806 [Eutypa lata UCREL1]|uniref:Uncharacterized protein n=1 Tax=Eutypa lata (strain UCR-EL1) TaxID=1287681 RepID=M7TQI1_EUTLA|nr:hypothetical protein UCREL1_806 [Eutypa lata UCREL1]
MTLALLLLLETLTLAASAARLDFPPAATPTVEDGANAVLLRPSPTPTARFATAELLHGRDYTMGQDTCGFGSAQPGITYECYLEEATCKNIGEYRGCCTSGLSSCSSTMWTTCEDYQSISVCGINLRFHTASPGNSRGDAFHALIIDFHHRVRFWSIIIGIVFVAIGVFIGSSAILYCVYYYQQRHP